MPIPPVSPCRLLLGTCVYTLCLTVLVYSYQCGPCQRSMCPSLPAECPGGQTLDSCNCCPLCAHIQGEACSTVLYGSEEQRCAEGLICKIDPPVGAFIEDHHTGICQASIDTEAPLPADCDRALCQVVFVPDCPKDSLVVKVIPPPGQCCPEPPTCQCLPCVSSDLQCPEGQLKVIVLEGLGTPGQCCDIYQCKDKDEVCRDIVCDADYLLELPCPADSIRLPPHLTKNGCCQQSQGCACRTVFECEPVKCDDDQRPEVTRAMGLPGDCCDTWKCVNLTAATCNHQDLQYEDGETWQFDACTTCRCDNGLTFCEAQQCETPTHCSWMGVPPGECCPICRGCVTEQGEHQNGATWKQSDCVTCRCEAGQVYCQAQLCAIECTHPRKVPGECCPVCDSNQTHIALPSHCPSLRGCDLHCLQGYIVDQYGCNVCQCKPTEPTFECNLSCPEGFLEDPVSGDTLCECQQPSFQCPSIVNCTIECLYGLRRDKDGCPKCKCRKCPQFECTKKCVLGYVHNNKGCQLCKCLAPSTLAPLTTTTSQLIPTRQHPGRLCMSVDGKLLEEGESWHDGCRRCFCHQGREMCALISCPVPQCIYPFIKSGDCCPSCVGDVIQPSLTSRCLTDEGIQLREAETWQLDECTLCICHDGGMLCEIESCPPVLCHHPVKLKGRCCATCPDEGALQPVGLPDETAYICLSPSGTVYDHGDTWRVNACQSCVCRNGQIHCFSQTCPILDCETTTLKKGQCCPTCTDAATRRRQQCVHAGVEYSKGEMWMLDDCTRCFCLDGQQMCSDDRCEELPIDCPTVVFLPGVCCPLCTTTSTQEPTEEDTPHTVAMVTQPSDNSHHLTTSFQLTLSIFIPIVVLLILLVVILVLALLRRRRARSHDLPDSTSISHFNTPSHGDVFKKRPKSTNLDLQGVDPFLNEKKKAPMNDYISMPGIGTGVNNEYSTVNEYATLEGLQNQINNEYMPLTGSDNKAAIIDKAVQYSKDNKAAAMLEKSVHYSKDNNNKTAHDKLWRYSCGDKTSKALICDTSANRKSM